MRPLATRHLLPLVLALPLALVACRKTSQPPAAATGAPGAPGAARAEGIGGKVLERIDAASYSYLRLATAQGEVWAAVPQAAVAEGTQVTLVNPMPMNGFESKTLKRTFAVIYFGNLAPAGGGFSAPAAEAGAPHAKPAAEAPEAPIHVAKATGPEARTIAEVFAGKASLAGRPVTLRGQVVKFTPDILGRNWIHLQDGTGAAAQATHDLTVTTRAKVKVGDVVVVQGTLRTDKDFGAGYTYAVLLEDARLVP